MPSNRIKFYTDEHVARVVSEGLRRRGVNVLRAQDAGMLEAVDLDHLKFAEREGRILLTQDADFLRLHDQGVSHCGIVYAPQHTPIRQMVRGLILIHEILTPQEMIGRVEFL